MEVYELLSVYSLLYMYMLFVVVLCVVTLATFHLRAPPTPDDAVGREGGGCSGPSELVPEL